LEASVDDDLSMSDFDSRQHYVGVIAWGESHAAVALNRAGEVVTEFEFGPFGWREFQDKVSALVAPAIASEFMFGNVIDQLATRGYTFYPINPDNLRRYFEPMRGVAAQGGKPLARLMADALRTHGSNWKTMAPDDDLIPTLRHAWSEERKSREFFGETFNHLQTALARHFPEIRPVFDWTNPSSWSFVDQYPTPNSLRRAKHQHVEKFLKANGLAGTDQAVRCLELIGKLEKTADSQPSAPRAEEEVRRFVELLRGAAEVYRRAELLTAQVVHVHRDYAAFGPPIPEPAASAGAPA
jgi:hypothetical protein